MASSGREKMAGRLISKQKRGDTTVQIFRNNGGRSKERRKREKSRVGTKKHPSKQRFTKIDSGKEYSNVVVIIYKQRDKAKKDK